MCFIKHNCSKTIDCFASMIFEYIVSFPYTLWLVTVYYHWFNVSKSLTLGVLCVWQASEWYCWLYKIPLKCPIATNMFKIERLLWMITLNKSIWKTCLWKTIRLKTLVFYLSWRWFWNLWANSHRFLSLVDRLASLHFKDDSWMINI